ncbi:MAG: sigma-54-dependent Fis family transcriptional regulator [Bacteroidetes bacterium]|nr:sigma-54-dependent Fis family transcriptional regulator [Bacteroidota bacterium]MCW5893960.1 sigma-54-dependent Fis family transcriptional regulator [Bacteroidota bacterium]
MTKVMIIDDDDAICAILKDVLEIEGYDVTYSLSGEEGVVKYMEELPSVLLLDLRLPGMDGLQVLKEVVSFDPDAIVIMITGYGSVDSAVGAIRMGATDYLQKPLSNDEITYKIESALRNKTLQKELSYLKEYINKRFSMNSIIRESESMAAAVEMLQKISAYDKPLLIVGEPGTGKDLAAWAVHHSGRRKEKPMVVFDCAAYPPSIMETELFGDGKPVAPRKIGKIEEANLGTLYLDRIDWLALPAQEAILSIIQTKTFKPRYGGAPVPCDIHLIASTTSDLKLLSRQGKFNAQLYDLIRQYEVVLPALRERDNDIPVLATHFVEEANREFNLSVSGLEPGAVRKLINHSWPGNVRELRNVIRAAMTQAQGTIREKDIVIHRQGVLN